MPHNDLPDSLFASDELSHTAPAPTPACASTSPRPKATPRYRRPQRNQILMFSESHDQRLEPDHPARIIWELTEQLDLSSLYDRIRAVEGHVGRDPSDPKVLFALWLYATAEGIGSARHLEFLCGEQRGFAWIRGGVPLNYHLLADFRVDHQELLDRMFTDSLAGLVHEGLINLEHVAQDGLRVRASAGQSSFRRRPSLEESLQQAQDHLARAKAQAEDDSATPRQKQARERAARERVGRVTKALDAVKEIAEQREKRKKGDGVKARASTTDPEARNMKMPDSGFRPAHNVQLATDTQTRIIVGMDVINQGTDAGQMKPMQEQVEGRTGREVPHWSADGGYTTLEDIEQMTTAGTMVYVPVKEAKRQQERGENPYQAKPKDSGAIGSWRVRMGTELGKAMYKLRASTAELTNARLRNRGLYGVTVRGLAKVKTVLLWQVLMHNLLLGAALRAEKQGKMALSPAG